MQQMKKSMDDTTEPICVRRGPGLAWTKVGSFSLRAVVKSDPAMSKYYESLARQLGLMPPPQQ